MKRTICCGFMVMAANFLQAQDTVKIGEKYIVLSPVVVGKNMNVAAFIQKVRTDTGFYKAFKNLRVLNYTSTNDIRMMDDEGKVSASLRSTTVQHRTENCRTMETLDRQVTGDMLDAEGNFNYYTARMYADLFFTNGKICGETNAVADMDFGVHEKSGMGKRKAQLKMLFFNPGKRVPGLPFMSNKTSIYDDDMAPYYDFSLDYAVVNKVECLLLHQQVKPGAERDVVVQQMDTWFDGASLETVARDYRVAYRTLFYGFRVQMHVEMAKVQGFTVPALLRYDGEWKTIGSKKEKGLFTATLSGFSGER